MQTTSFLRSLANCLQTLQVIKTFVSFVVSTECKVADEHSSTCNLHEVSDMLDKFNQNWNAATLPRKTAQYQISLRPACRRTKRLHHSTTVMLTGMKTVVPIAREIYSYERTRKEVIGAFISFLQYCCIFAPRNTLKGLAK
jgi:hypothetical protein